MASVGGPGTTSLLNVQAMMEEDEDSLPPFANEANKALDSKIRERERQLAKTEGDLDNHLERVNVMREHLKHVRVEIQNTQQLLEAKIKETESEDHLAQLAKRDAGRFDSELKKNEVERKAIQDRLNVVQNETFKARERLDQFSKDMDWGEEELEQWAAAAQQKEEDSKALKKYSNADELKVKDLALQIEKLTVDRQQKRKALEAEVTETQAAQIELDKTADAYKRQHQERAVLVKQWEEAIETLAKRDEMIMRRGEEYARLKNVTREKKAAVDAQQRSVDAEAQGVKEAEAALSNAERMVGKLRTDLQRHAEGITVGQDEVESLRNTVKSVEADLQSKLNDIAAARAGIEDRKARVERERETLESTRKRLGLQLESTEEQANKARTMEDALEVEQGESQRVAREAADLKTVMFKQSQELFRLRQDEANLIAEINGAQAALKNLNSKIKKLDQQSLKQQELVYNQEFQLQQLERKVSRALGERSDEEKKVLNERIQQLQVVLDELGGELHLLQAQKKRIQDEVRSKKRTIEAGQKTRSSIESKIEALLLDNESAERQVKVEERKREELMVQGGVLRLEQRRLRDALHLRADEVFGLENRKAQLQLSMEEREAEISVHHDTLRAQYRAVEEERHKAAMELRDRAMRVGILRKKYESMMRKVAPGEEGEHSQAYFVIRAAQEREELQQKGDALDDDIRKAEQEVRYLENTLRTLNLRNEAFRTSFQRVGDGSVDLARKQQLEEKYRAAAERYKFRRREIREADEEIELLERRLDQLTRDCAKLDQKVALAKEQKDKDILKSEALEVKIDKAGKKAGVLLDTYHKMHATQGTTDVERELLVREQEERNQATLVMLANAVHAEDVGEKGVDVFYRVCEESGLQVPKSAQLSSRASSHASSRASSRASSMSSQGSVRSTSSRGSVKSAKSSRSVRSSRSARSVRSSASRSSVRSKTSSKASKGPDLSGLVVTGGGV